MGFYLPLSDIILRVCTSPDTSSETSPQTGNDLLLSTSIREESGEIHWIISLYQVNEKAQGNVKGMRTRGLLYSERVGIGCLPLLPGRGRCLQYLLTKKSGPTALGCWAEEAREALENGEFELDDGAKMSVSVTVSIFLFPGLSLAWLAATLECEHGRANRHPSEKCQTDSISFVSPLPHVSDSNSSLYAIPTRVGKIFSI